MRPFFSIIIPLYNGDRTIAACLDSVLDQSFDDYEVIIADGGSTDKSLEIIHQFRQAYPEGNIRLRTEKDGGVYDAMNKGITLSKGTWLYFMGCDDKLNDRDVLRAVAGAIKNYGPADLIYGNVSGDSSGIQYTDDTPAKVLARGIHHQSIFYQRSLFKAVGKYDTGFKVAADYHLTLRVFADPAFKIKYIGRAIARFGESGLSSREYDYKFFSYHYKFLVQLQAVDKINAREQCLQTSIYCCLHLARTKRDMFFAWRNILFYISLPDALHFTGRLKTLLRMIYWSLKPYNHSTVAAV